MVNSGDAASGAALLVSDRMAKTESMAAEDRPPHESPDGGRLSRRGFLAIGGGALAGMVLAGCVVNDIIGGQQGEVLAMLHAHEVNGFLVFETTVPGGELFAKDLAGGYVQWSDVQNYSIEEWDDGFVHAPAYP